MIGLPANHFEKRLLKKACRYWGVQPGYIDAEGNLKNSTPKALITVLSEVTGRSVETVKDLEKLIRDARKLKLDRRIEPIVCLEENQNFETKIYWPTNEAFESLEVFFRLEDGETEKAIQCSIGKVRNLSFEDKDYFILRIKSRATLPVGYHRLILKIKDKSFEVSLFCAPMQLKIPEQKRWGVFSPLYAIRSQTNWGIGDLRDLEELQKFIHKHGGDWVGVLPLLALTNTGENFDPSPYSPSTRMFWNEIFLDVEKLLKEQNLSTTIPKDELLRLREPLEVNYLEVFELKSKVLLELTHDFFAKKLNEDDSFKTFVAQTPYVEAFARWKSLDSQELYNYHLYVQFQMFRHLLEQRNKVNEGRLAGLYLDFPVGVSKAGFDAIQFKDAFIPQLSAGAPPDTFFRGGQNWGFSPLHPFKIRESSYDYFILCIRQHMKFATALRLDHAMGFFRIYVVPEGAPATEGAYISYNSKEFFSILKIEAERAKITLVGEDLGTVPPQVREKLKQSGMLRMWVLPFEAAEKFYASASKIEGGALVCLNTHDMIPFAGYETGLDVDLFRQLGIFNREQSLKEFSNRRRTKRNWAKELRALSDRDLWDKVMKALAASRAHVLLLNVEDLWGEKTPQNIPGTWKEYPNWKRKWKVEFEEWSQDPKILRFFEELTIKRSEPQQVRNYNKEVRHGSARA